MPPLPTAPPSGVASPAREFTFSEVIPNDTDKEINNLDTSKKGIFKNINPKSLKEVTDVRSPLLCNLWAEEMVQRENFPKDLKNAYIIPVFKKNNLLLAKNFRTVTDLATLSKIFETLMQKQIIEYKNQSFSFVMRIQKRL